MLWNCCWEQLGIRHNNIKHGPLFKMFFKSTINCEWPCSLFNHFSWRRSYYLVLEKRNWLIKRALGLFKHPGKVFRGRMCKERRKMPIKSKHTIKFHHKKKINQAFRWFKSWRTPLWVSKLFFHKINEVNINSICCQEGMWHCFL